MLGKIGPGAVLVSFLGCVQTTSIIFLLGLIKLYFKLFFNFFLENLLGLEEPVVVFNNVIERDIV